MASAQFAEQVISAASAAATTGAIRVLGGSAHGVVYVTWSSGCTAGVVTVEEARNSDYTGTWEQVGTVVWSAASKADAVHFAGVYGALRARISTAIVGGTVDVDAIIYG